MAKYISDEDKMKAMRSSRAGVFAEQAIVPQVASEFMLPTHKILDYGAGKKALHAQKYKDMGFNVTAHDHHGVPGVHDPTALDRRYDLVYASNVLNTQNSPHALAVTLNQIARSVHPQGMAIVNLTGEPRYGAFARWTPDQHVSRVEAALKRRFGKVVRHPRGTNAEPVWILTEPRHVPDQAMPKK